MRDQIIDKYKEKGVYQGKTWMFKAPEAMKIIEDVDNLGLVVLGMDALIVEEKNTTVDDYVDYSDEIRQGINVKEAALNWVRARHNKGLYFEIVIN